MARLSTKKRHSLSDAMFGLPKERKYPMSDKAHARNAKARASEEHKAGKLSAAKEAKVDRKANKILYGSAKHGKARVG